MKKFYVLIVVTICLAANGFAQNYHWIGLVNGNWENNSNWSNTSGGSAASDFPHLSTDNVIFEANATIQLNTAIELNTLTVSGTSTTVKVTAIGGSGLIRTITGYSTSTENPAISIASGCRLESSAADNTIFTFVFADDAKGEIDGDWYFTGNINNDALASFFLGTTGFSTRLNVNTGGSITIGTTGYTEPNEDTGDEYLVFNAGSSLNLMSNGPIVPHANYHASSIVNITGVTDASVSFEETASVGNIIYNCASQSNGSNLLSLSLIGLDIQGDLNVLNTNNNELALLFWPFTTGLPSVDVTIKGDLNIQGNSRVAIARNDGPEIPNNLFVEGDLIANGTSLSLHSGNFVSGDPTVLHVAGNIQHTAGTLTASSTVINQTTDLFVIEMNGTAAQTISSHNGNFDNGTNQVTLRMNNSFGATLLTSLSVGRLDFNTANKGILTTNANIITVNNTTPGSVSNIVVNLPLNPAQGFVNGNIRRRSESVEPLVLPAGSGALYRGVTLVPSSPTLTTYQAGFVNSDHGGTYTSPVQGVANYYWNISRIGAGADAQIQLEIPGAIPGALAGHELAVAKFNGTSWVSTKGTTGLTVSPGTASSGTVRSEAQSSFGTYTISFQSESVLPTVLVSFTGVKSGNATAGLKWKITENSTPSVFEVLRSADGINFKSIGSVVGSDNNRDYHFTDEKMLNGNNYYRLKMSDKDGSVTYSTIIMLSNGVDGIVIQSMMPTMVRDRTRLNITSSSKVNLQLVVTDVNGRVIQNQSVSLQPGNQDIWINATRLAQGMYQVTGYAPGEKTATYRFIKL